MFNDLDLYNKRYQKKIFKSIFKTVKENNFIFGEKVEKLEKQLSKFTGSKICLHSWIRNRCSVNIITLP